MLAAAPPRLQARRSLMANQSYPTHETLRSRASWLWFGALLSAFTLVPALPVLGLAYIWRGGAADTRYENHFKGIIRSLWCSLGIWSVASGFLLVSPNTALAGFVLAAGLLCVSAIRGLSAARHAEPFHRLRLFRKNRSGYHYAGSGTATAKSAGAIHAPNNQDLYVLGSEGSREIP